MEVLSYAEEHQSDIPLLGGYEQRLSLALSGLLRPIIEVHNSDIKSKVMDFFDHSRWPMHRRSHWPIPLLVEVIRQASNLCDRKPLDFEAIFLRHDLYETDEGEMVRNYDGLLRYLETELGATPMEGYHYQKDMGRNRLGYSYVMLRKEVERVLQGLTFFTYRIGQGSAPGIAFSTVKVGDFIYRPGYEDNLSPHALVLRSNRHLDPQDRHYHLDDNAFRLVGCCLDSEPWWYRYERRNPGEAHGDEHRDRIVVQ
jgi:hypothetical protein